MASRAVRLELAVEPFEDSLRATNSILRLKKNMFQEIPAMSHPAVFQMTTAFGGLELKVSVSFFHIGVHELHKACNQNLGIVPLV